MSRQTSRSMRPWLGLAAISCLAVVSLASAGRAVDLSVAKRTGVLPSQWIKGGPDCSKLPSFQIHAYNSDFYILRESGCVHSEKPFLYLLFGSERAILFDAGAGGEEGATRETNTSEWVHYAISKWAAKAKRPVPPLVVGHLHSHDDHTYGDPQFAGAPDTTFIPPNDVPALQAAYSIPNWPTDIGSIDLGGRVLDVIPIPGHDDMSFGSLLEMLDATTYREADGTITQRAYKDFSVCGTYPNCAAVNVQ
jgi:hydroxyacylglutathione hydrolase